MDSPGSIRHFDMEIIRQSLAETELRCALLRDIECKQRHTNQPKKIVEPIVLVNTTFDRLKEKSDGSNDNQLIGKFTKHVHDNESTGNSGLQSYHAKAFVPPKQVLMYLVR